MTSRETQLQERGKRFLFLHDFYDIGPIAQAEKIEKGYLTNNHVLETESGKYFLKEYHSQETVERMREIHRAKNYFSRGGIPIILPLESRARETFIEHGGRYYALFPFIDGRAIDEEDLTPTSIESLGEVCASIHLLGKKKEAPRVKKEFKPWDWEAFFQKAEQILEVLSTKTTKDSMDILVEEMVRQKISLAERFRREYGEFGFKNDHLIHGDFHDANVFFEEDDRVKYVFDLEKAEMAPRIYEVIRSLDLICLGGKSSEKNLENGRQYLLSYHKKYPLGEKEFQNGTVAYFLGRVYSLWAEEEYCLKGNLRVIPLLPRGKERLQFWVDHLDEIKNLFHF